MKKGTAIALGRNVTRMNHGDSTTGHRPSSGSRDRRPTDRGSTARSAQGILTETGFAAAMRQALRDFHRPNELRNNPLLTTRLVAAVLQREPAAPPTQALREILRDHCERLGDNAKFDWHKQILILTYLKPLRSQQAVAEALHLSWSTYRRHLVEAIQTLAAVLWEAESACALSEIQDVAAETGAAQVPRHRVTSAHIPRWLTAGAAVVFLAIGSGVMLLHATRQGAVPRASPVAPNPPTLAVLPFRDLNHDPATRYLSDGMTEELIARLGRIPTLQVVAPTSSYSLRGKAMDVREAGRLLGADKIVEGTIQQHGSRLRIDVALVNAADGYELWTDEFTAGPGEMLRVEDAIAATIAGKLNLPHAPLPAPSLQLEAMINPQARDFYLVGLEYLNNRDPDDISRSVAYLRKSIQVDGNYAQAWAALAMAYAVMRSYQADVAPDTYYDDALVAANRAVTLDASLPRAHEVLGLLDDQHWKWVEAAREYRKALHVDPSDATAHQWYGIHLWFMGRMQAALHQMQTAHRLDPLSPIINADLGRALCYAGKLRASLAQYRATVALAPRFALTYAFMAETDLAIGNPQQALTDTHTAVTIWGRPPEFSLAEIGVSEILLGRKDLARGELDALQKTASRQYVSGVLLAWLYWNMGDKDQAFTQLRRAVRDHDFVIMFVFGPMGAGLRADPRFAEIRRSMKLPPAPIANRTARAVKRTQRIGQRIANARAARNYGIFP